MSFKALLFVHVPKTAGTSFRHAVELLFPGKVAYDYGPDSPVTTALIREHCYPKLDVGALREGLEQDQIAMLGGHIDYQRYADVFPPERVVAFVRDPVSRLVSEHAHVVRNYGFQGSLEDFAARPRNRSLQSAVLRGVPLEGATLIGVTEKYAASLTLLEERIGWQVPELVRNLNPDRNEVASRYEPEPDLAAKLAEWNRADQDLFDWACRTLDGHELPPPSTLDVERAVQRPSRGVLGGYTTERGVYGWAHLTDDATPARVRIFVDGEERETVVATRPRPDLVKKQLHSTGAAGFELAVGDLSAGTVVRAIVEQTNIELANSPYTVE